jgi:putative flippase GtrA
MLKSHNRKTLTELSWFSVFALVNFCTNVFLTGILVEWLLVPPQLAFAFCLFLAFMVSFISFRYVVFAESRQKQAGKQLALFFITTLCFRGLEYAAFTVLNVVFGLHYMLSVLSALTASFLGKFFFYRRHVFGSSFWDRHSATAKLLDVNASPEL